MATEEELLLDRQLCFALYATSRAMMQAYQPLLEPLGLTYPQYLVMLVLWEQDGATVGQLGGRLRLDSGTLTPLLKRLEAQGLVQRRRSGKDERVVEVHLSTQGKRLRQKAERIPEAMACKAGLGLPELERLRETLLELGARLRQEPR